MNTSVHEQNGSVTLEDISGWFVGDKESSVHAAQEAVMQALGEDVAYEAVKLQLREVVDHEDKTKPYSDEDLVKQLAKHGAKIVAMGADLAHSLTMIHLAEDLKGNDWPVPTHTSRAIPR